MDNKEKLQNFFPKNVYCLKCELEKRQKKNIGNHWIACACFKTTTLQEQIEKEDLIKSIFEQSLKKD